MRPEQSIEIIQSMMAEAKHSFHKVSPYFLIWGVILSISGIAEHVIVYHMQIKEGFIVWGVLGCIGGIISMIYSIKESKKQQVKNYYDVAYGYLWGGLGVTLILTIVLTVMNQLNPTPFILILTGLPTFATGGLIRFKPLIFGGIVFWVAGIIAFNIPNMYTGVVFSIAIILGYLIPGIILNRQENNANA